MFHGTKPKIDHLRTIGCTAYVHVPPKSRSFKFSPSAKITRLIGYSESRKAYRVVDSAHKIFDARDITFNEFENLAGQKGFPGADAVVLGNYEEYIPVEIDDGTIPPTPPLTTPSELQDREYYQARLARMQANPPMWGSPDGLSSTPNTVYQPNITAPTTMPATSAPTNNTVEQGGEHNPHQQPSADPTSPTNLHNQELAIPPSPDISTPPEVDSSIRTQKNWQRQTLTQLPSFPSCRPNYHSKK